MELLLSFLGEILGPLIAGIAEVLLALLGEALSWMLELLFDWGTGNRRKPPQKPAVPSSGAAATPLVGRAKRDAERAADALVARADDTASILPGLLFNATFGILIGIGSIFLMPTHFISSPLLRIVMIPVGAVACGLIVPRIGRLLRGDRPGRSLATGRFADAFVFALVFSLVRYFGAH